VDWAALPSPDTGPELLEYAMALDDSDDADALVVAAADVGAAASARLRASAELSS
jgi:hypothetical protein